MAYGIEVIGEDASGSYKVTDTNLDLVNYAVVATGTGSTISMTTGSSGTGGKKTILLINANQSGNTAKIISCGFGGFSKVMKKLTFSTDQYNNISVSSSASATVDYILLKDMTGIGNATGSGDYGLQIKTAAGEVMVDSRRFRTDTTFLFKAAWAPGTRSGMGSSLTNDPDLYCDVTNFQLLTTGDNIDGAGALWNPSGSYVGIRHYNWIEDLGIGSEGGSQSNQASMYFSNFNTILIGE